MNVEEFEENVFEEPNTPKNEKKEKKNGRMYFLCFIAGLVGVMAGSAVTYSFIGGKTEKIQQQPITIETKDDINFVSAVAQKNSKSVVGITIKEKVYDFFRGERLIEGMGSGVIVDSNGYILTNSHVVGDGKAEDITVKLYNEEEYTGKVLWNNSVLDLAVVKIESENLPYAEFGDSDSLIIGEPVVAIGNPYSLDLERTVTSGIVSGLNRSIQIDQYTKIEPLIQTDASINPGNSGGPLLDAKGRVIGINTAKINSAEGLGFAIPVNIAKPVIEDLISNGKVSDVYIGIKGIDVKTYEDRLNIDISADYGVVVIEVISDSPADKADLKPGDVIQKIGEKEVKDMGDILRILYEFKPGDKSNIELIRNGEKQNVEITYMEKPDN